MNALAGHMRGSATRYFIAAAAFGAVHAAFSAYWALGGTWMLRTVGAWAEQWTIEQPGQARATLAALTLVKLLAAVCPLLAFMGKLPWRHLIFGLAWVASVLLIAWGGLSFLGAVLGLVLSTDNREVKVGHLFFDGIFILWGVSLLIGLIHARKSTPIDDDSHLA